MEKPAFSHGPEDVILLQTWFILCIFEAMLAGNLYKYAEHHGPPEAQAVTEAIIYFQAMILAVFATVGFFCRLVVKNPEACRKFVKQLTSRVLGEDFQF